MLLLLGLAAPLGAEPVRLAVFHTDLERAGPGLLLRDILGGDDAEVLAVSRIIGEVDPDILLILGFDYDAGLVALDAFADGLSVAYPERFALRPNAGQPTGLDVDADGRFAEPQDAQGYGRFSGEGGMAILSRLPIDRAGVRDFSGLLWRDLPGNRAEQVLAPEVSAVLRLSTMAIWDVPVVTDQAGGRLHLLAIHAGPPVFDGPEDRNGFRNEDETAFLLHYLSGWSPEGTPAFEAPAFAIMGTLNVDPVRGEGRRGALMELLADPRLQDPVPRDPDGGTATSNWNEPNPGRLRVDYILPDRGLRVLGAGVHGVADDPGIADASGHRLVWVDIDLPREGR